MELNMSQSELFNSIQLIKNKNQALYELYKDNIISMDKYFELKVKNDLRCNCLQRKIDAMTEKNRKGDITCE